MTAPGLAAAAMVGVLSAPAAAQQTPVDPAADLRHRARVEVGAQVGALSVYPGAAIFGVFGPRLTLNLTSRDAFETIAEAAGGVEDAGLHGLYGVQYKRTLGSRVLRPRTWFATAGVLGSFRHYRQREWKDQRPDGSTVVWPGYRSFTMRKPTIATIGLGVERQVRPHLALRADAQAFAGSGGVGVRVAAGVSVPIGGAHASRP